MVAAPVAKEIYRRIYSLRGHNTEPLLQASTPTITDPYRSTSSGSLKGQLLSTSIPVMKASAGRVTIPDLKGMSMKMSLSGLYAMGLKPVVHGSGRVIRQIPAAGKVLNAGQTIEIFLGDE